MQSFSLVPAGTKRLCAWLVPALLLTVFGGCGGSSDRKDDSGATDAAAEDSGHTDAASEEDASQAEDGSTDDADVDASDASLPITDVGGVCAADGDCSHGLCLTNVPSGYCSGTCTISADCGAGATCIDSRCYAACASHADCTRTGYFCTPLGLTRNEQGQYTLASGCYIGRRLSGTVSMPEGMTLTVRDDGGGMLTLGASGPFTLPKRIPFQSPYNVTFEVLTNVPGYGCAGSDLAGQALGHVTNLSIVCARQSVFTSPGTYAWVVPQGVTSVSVVAVGSGGRGYGNRGGGGGELCYQNDIPVTPGATITVVVGNLLSDAVGGHDSRFGATLVAHGGSDAFQFNQWEVPGGTGGTVGTCFAGGFGSYNSSSGGAAGYAGIGGHAYMYAEMPAADGAGGGGAGGGFATPGGGVGLEGIGANGIARGGHGSRATPSVPVAGGGGTTYSDMPQTGGHGGVRIIWGAGRSYPSNAANL